MIDLGNGVQMVTRGEWGARAPRSVTACAAPFGVTSHWEGPHMGEFPHSSCASKVRGIQNYHMDSQGWTDIAYSALSCPHGYVFEGRGPGVRTAANGTTEGNDKALAVCFLGGEGDPFTEVAKRAQRAACDWLDRNGAGSGRNCHRDWKNTACPGDVICSWVKAGLPVEEDEDMNWTEYDKTIIRNIIRQELYGDDKAHSKGLTPIIRREVQAVMEEMLTTPHSVMREEHRELAKLGTEDAMRPPEG